MDVHLRDGITWSDGEPITAHDFVWTATSSWRTTSARGATATAFTESIEAVDDHTIVWKTTRPRLVPGLPGYSLILPEHVWGEMTEQGDQGLQELPRHGHQRAFKLVEWEPGEFWRVEAREDYYGGAPAIDEIVFRVYNSDEAVVQALIKGEIDYTLVATPALYETREGQARHRDGGRRAPRPSTRCRSTSSDDPKSTAHPAVLDPVVRGGGRVGDRQGRPWSIASLRGYGTPGTTPIVPLYDFWHWEPPAEEAIGFDPGRSEPAAR